MWLSLLTSYELYTCVRTRPKIGNAALCAAIWGGVFREIIFLKVRFQKAVDNSPAKWGFDFGSRCCRLWSTDALFFQK